MGAFGVFKSEKWGLVRGAQVTGVLRGATGRVERLYNTYE